MSIQPIDDGNLFSVSRLARLTGYDRRTVTKRLESVKPAASRHGHAVYHLADAGPALFTDRTTIADMEAIDPATLPPPERDKWYASEIKRLELETRMGRLLDAEETRQRIAETFKRIATSLDTMCDVIEREAGLTPEQVTEMQRIIDQMRAELFAQVAEGDDG